MNASASICRRQRDRSEVDVLGAEAIGDRLQPDAGRRLPACGSVRFGERARSRCADASGVVEPKEHGPGGHRDVGKAVLVEIGAGWSGSLGGGEDSIRAERSVPMAVGDLYRRLVGHDGDARRDQVVVSVEIQVRRCEEHPRAKHDAIVRGRRRVYVDVAIRKLDLEVIELSLSDRHARTEVIANEQQVLLEVVVLDHMANPNAAYRAIDPELKLECVLGDGTVFVVLKHCERRCRRRVFSDLQRNPA